MAARFNRIIEYQRKTGLGQRIFSKSTSLTESQSSLREEFFCMGIFQQPAKTYVTILSRYAKSFSWVFLVPTATIVFFAWESFW
jgi:hypothetical protein